MSDKVDGSPDPAENDQNSSKDTQDTETAPPAKDDSGHGDEDESSAEKDELAKKREAGKLPQVQQEFAKYKEEAEPDLARLRNIENRAIASPENYKQALVLLNGVSEQEADVRIQRMQAQGFWPNQGQQIPDGQQGASLQVSPQFQPQVQQQGMPGQAQVPPTGRTQAVDPFVAAEEVFQQKEVARRLQASVFERIPEIDPRNVSTEKVPMVKKLAETVEELTRQRIESDPKKQKDDIMKTFVDEYVEVYKEFTGKTDEELENAREEGRVEGYLNATADQVSTQKSGKGYTPKDQTFGLTPEQLKQAEIEGLTPEEFAKLEANPVAQIGEKD